MASHIWSPTTPELRNMTHAELMSYTVWRIQQYDMGRTKNRPAARLLVELMRRYKFERDRNHGNT